MTNSQHHAALEAAIRDLRKLVRRHEAEVQEAIDRAASLLSHHTARIEAQSLSSPQRPFYTIKQLAELQGCSVAAVYRDINAGLIPGISRVGRRTLIPAASVTQWLDINRVNTRCLADFDNAQRRRRSTAAEAGSTIREAAE